MCQIASAAASLVRFVWVSAMRCTRESGDGKLNAVLARVGGRWIQQQTGRGKSPNGLGVDEHASTR